jgi:hypothetical protein
MKPKSNLHCDWRSVSMSWWFSWPDVCYCLTFTVMSLWGTLSDKRSGMSFATQSSVCPKFEVTLWLTVCLGIEHSCGTCDQILFPVGMLLSEICCLVSMGRPPWLEDESAICSVITQWSESLRTHNHTLLSHLRLPQPGGPGSHIYIPQEQGSPVIPVGTGFPLRRLLRLAGLWWRYYENGWRFSG